MQNLFFGLVILFTAIGGCSNNNQNDKSDVIKTAPEQKIAISDSNVIKVYVDETGVITANGNSISLEGLDSSFNKLKINNGIVYYSRANGQGEPPPESMKVIELVVKYSLPIKLYTDKTFSVLVKPN
jgi:hypothetical protein